MLKLFTADELKARYGGFYEQAIRMASNVQRFGGLRAENIPPVLRPLIPYAELWGEPDDDYRVDLWDIAPAEAREDLENVLQAYMDELLTAWTEEYGKESTSLEKNTFTCMLMLL